MMTSTGGLRPSGASTPSRGSQPDLMVLCRAGRWDEVREWLLRRRQERPGRDDDDPSASPPPSSSSSSPRREVSVCPRGGGMTSEVSHFADLTSASAVMTISGQCRNRPPPCHCDTALSIACEMTTPSAGRAPPHAPMDVVEALWRFCPDQLVHNTFGIAVGDASTPPTVSFHPTPSGTPLHHALWAVRWGEGGEDGGVRGTCSGLDLVECLVEADVALAGGWGGREAALPLVASQLRDHRGRTPLQIWVYWIFPRLMTLGGPPAAEDAEEEVVAAAIAADATPTSPDAHSDHAEEAMFSEGAVFNRWMEVLRKLLLAYPRACSTPLSNGATLLMTVLKWKVMEHRLLRVVRVVLESSPEATYGSCSRFGCSPLHYAVEYGHSSGVIGAVLDASSSSSTKRRTTSTPLPLRRNNVMEVPLLVAATLRAPLSVMGLLLRRRCGGCAPAEQATALDRGGRSPLTWAYIRFLEHHHGTILSRKKKSGGGTSRGDAGRVSRERRKNTPRDLKTMEEEVLGSLRRCANREELLSELGPFWDVVQLLLISAYHGRGLRSTIVSSGDDAADAETTDAWSATAATLADARSFLGVEASVGLIEQVRVVLAPRDVRGKRRWRVVHAAASLPSCCPRGVLAIATMVHPDQLRVRDERGHLPLHLAIAAQRGNHCGTTVEEEASGKRWTHDETGPSAVQTVLADFPDAAGMADGPTRRLPLHVAIEHVLPRLRETSSSSTVPDAMSPMGRAVSSSRAPPRSILRNRMRYTKSTPSSAAAAAALVEARFRHDVRSIAMAHPVALGEGDVAPGTGGLLPFMRAAAGPRGSTCLAYELLREGPDVVGRFIPPSPGKEKGQADGGSGGPSASSRGVGGPIPVPSSSGSSSPSSSAGRPIEVRGRRHNGETPQKRARWS